MLGRKAAVGGNVGLGAGVEVVPEEGDEALNAQYSKLSESVLSVDPYSAQQEHRDDDMVQKLRPFAKVAPFATLS
jgi:hypothetical protein